MVKFPLGISRDRHVEAHIGVAARQDAVVGKDPGNLPDLHLDDITCRKYHRDNFFL